MESYIKCADPGWIYCPSPDNVAIGFCCLNGWVCYDVPLEEGHGVGCGPPGFQPGSSQSLVPTAWGAYNGPGQTSVITKNVTQQATAASKTTAHAAPTSTTPSHSPSSGLSTGAKAGIGVGAGIAGLGLLALVSWASFRFLRKRNTRAELPGQPSWFDAQPKLVDAQPKVVGEMQELNAYPPPAELAGARRAELPGSWEGYEVGGSNAARYKS